MDDILDALVGMDKKNEIFNLWYEVTFLRLILSHMVSKSQYLQEEINDKVLDECRKEAAKIVQDKFPVVKIDFTPPTTEQIEKKKKHFENLKVLNEKFSSAENVQESPCCIRPDSSESLPSSPVPSSEA